MQTAGWVVWWVVTIFLGVGVIGNFIRSIVAGSNGMRLMSFLIAFFMFLALALVPVLHLSPWHALWLPIAAFVAATLAGRAVVVMTGSHNW